MSDSPEEMRKVRTARTEDALEALVDGTCGDPTGVLGPLDAARPGAAGDDGSGEGKGRVRVFLPPALEVAAGPGGEEEWTPLARVHLEGVFEGTIPDTRVYRLRVVWDTGETSVVDDPYRFAPSLTEADFEAFRRGEETRLDRLLGGRPLERDGVGGTRFAVWAPGVVAVNVMGSFNGWEGRRHPMFPVGDTGVWELFVPGVGPGAKYKYQIRPRDPAGESEAARRASVPDALEKADPVGFQMELRPRTASIVAPPSGHAWTDDGWLARREDRQAEGRALSIYEVHLGSWRRDERGAWLGYRELAGTLLPYVRDQGFTHIELLPVTEHPHDQSWGYQTVGYFAPTSRYGTPDEFRAFVDAAHGLGLGVILDWVPAHFPLDAHGLARFTGRPLYEHADPSRGGHPDWGTAIFDYGRAEVISFLVSSARFWLESFHLDGLRVDAVASMLYLDYSRAEGEWEPNELGGRENLEAVALLRRLNAAVREALPGVLLCAEESTTWPGVTAPVEEEGLGFHLKWNMGWMNDTLSYFQTDPARRVDEHRRLTFSLHYAHHERHLLPLSHDEVVHLKRSLLSKMPGTYEEKFAHLRLLYGYMWTHPGAKLLFMGGEIAQWAEWSEQTELSWGLLEHETHRGIQRWVRALNARYRSDPALHALDEEPAGFEWADVHDAARSVLAYYRWSPEWKEFVAVVANFSARAWPGYRAALPVAGEYEITLDSDDVRFGGRGRSRLHGPAEEVPLHGRAASMSLDLPPLAVVLLRRAGVSDGPPGNQAA